MKIWLADLSYNTVTKSVDAFPLGIGMLASYLKAYLDTPQGLEIELFRDPNELRDALQHCAPDVLGVSNYVWNFRLSLEFARYAKELHPNILTVMGGPNFPLDAASQEKMLRDEMPEVDLYVIGNTYEGEVAFLEAMQRYSDSGLCKDVLQDAIPGCLVVDRASGRTLRGAPVIRIRDLDDIPSPYLTGLMDKFFDTGLFAKIQLVRGCPFGCTFCNSAVKSNNKAFRHSFERVKADLDYIVERVDHSSVLALADDNFGMYREDEEVAAYLRKLIDRYDWPRMLRTTTGKNNPERVLRVQETLKGRLAITASVQSMDEAVLNTINRSNIRLDVYEKIQAEVHKKGHQTYADVIIGLPGETLETLQAGSEKLLELGVHSLAAGQLLLLPGSLLEMSEARERYRFETKFRLVANCIGDFGTGRVVAETEEVVYQTPDFSFSDYIEYRKFHLISQIFWGERIFEEAFEFAKSYGISNVELLRSLTACYDKASEAFKANFEAYINGSTSELFDDRNTCVEWGAEMLDDIISGSVGGNIFYISIVRARLYLIADTIAMLGDGLNAALSGYGGGVPHQIEALLRYYRTICIGTPLAQSLNYEPLLKNTHDICAWREDKYKEPLETYELPADTTYSTKVDPDFRDLVLKRVNVFGETPPGLSRLVRSWHANSFRRKVVRPHSKPC